MVFSSSARTINHIFYRINLLNKSSPLNWVSKKPTWKENGYSQKRVRSPLLEECKLWPWKQRAELFVSMSSKIAWFLQKLYFTLFCTLKTFYPSSFFFFLSVTFKSLASSYSKMYYESMKWCMGLMQYKLGRHQNYCLLILQLLWVIKTEFLLTISIQYQADKWQE